jgi:carbon storage regulator CsrA
MLVLKRRIEEEIRIETPAGRVVVKVICPGTNVVALGIEAPPSIAVDRREVAEAKARHAGA